MRRPLPLFLLALLCTLPLLQCRNAGGAAEEPVEREAEEALVAYVRINTSNPPGNESAGAAFLRDLLTKEGVEARLVGSDPARQAVYARLASGSKEKALLLLSHIDVVPAESGAWTQPPFSGARSSGYIWGRGALDDKSLTIAELMAVLDLKRRGARLQRDVVFLAVPDEELGGIRGCAALLQSNPELFDNVGYVLNEGGSVETAVNQVLFWGIEVQQKVPLWLRVTADGQGGHGAVPPDNGGASAKLVRALAAISAIETPNRLTSDVATTAAAAAAVRRDARGARLGLFREPLDMKRINEQFPPGYRALLRDTITITALSGGSVANVIPSHASADLDIRLLPDQKPEPMIEQIRAAAAPNARVEILLSSQPVAASPWNTPLYEVLSRAMKASAPGSAVAPMVAAGTTDSRYLRARGMVAYGISPFKVNYYDADSVHGNDERIRARFFAEGIGLMRTIVRDFTEVK